MRRIVVETSKGTGSADLAIGDRVKGETAGIASSTVRPVPMARSRPGTLRFPDGSNEETVTRLIVPLPKGEFDEAGLARFLWQIVGATEHGLLLTCRIADEDDEMPARRRLTTLAALLRRHRTDRIDTTVVSARSWAGALRLVCSPGDAVVLPVAPPPAASGRSKELADRVLRDLRRPVYLMDALPADLLDEPPAKGRLRPLLAWAMPILIVLAFVGLQSEIVLQTPGSLQTVLLTATVALELATLLVAQSLVEPWK
jgi:hypothetical protein